MVREEGVERSVGGGEEREGWMEGENGEGRRERQRKGIGKDGGRQRGERGERGKIISGDSCNNYITLGQSNISRLPLQY